LLAAPTIRLAELELLLGPMLSQVNKREEGLRQPTSGDPGLSILPGTGGIPVMLRGEHPGGVESREPQLHTLLPRNN